MSSEANESGRSLGFGTSVEPLSTLETSETPPSHGQGLLFGVLAAFFLSGFAALLYQIAWLRQFAAVFGHGEFAGAAILAAYLGGTALGAALGGRYADRVRRPVLAYAFLQAGIGVSALATPLLIGTAGTAYVWAFGNLPEPPGSSAAGQPLFYFAAAFAVLVIPTALMGAALPLLSRYAVRSNIELGRRVAILYSTNTLGAASGALAGVFLLLPVLGLRGTVWIGVVVNAIVFILAALFARQAVPENARFAGDSAGSFGAAPSGFFSSCLRPLLLLFRGRVVGVAAAFSRQPAWILPLMLVSGGNAFVYLGLWTRMLSHVIGSGPYSLAIMLAAFLGGIALGSVASVRAARTRSIAAAAFAVSQAAIAIISIGVYAWMQALLPDTRSTGSLVLYVALVMLPATTFIGATFPLAVRVLAENAQHVGTVTGRVYAWSTVGAIAGAVLTGFYLIPALGLAGSIKVAVLASLLLALWVVVFVLPLRTLPVAVAAALLLLVSFGYQPARPQAVISSTAFVDTPKGLRETFFTMGRSAAVLLGERDGAFELRMNGLPDASVRVKGAPPIRRVQHWLHALPIAARPDASTMLVIGFGGGVAVEDVPSSIRVIDVVELEPEVIQANRRMSDLRLVDPLKDPRVNVVINDARNALQLTSKRYDIIVSRSSHPWTAGVSHLFTREFAELAESRLSDTGIFLQSIGVEFVDGELLRSLTAGLLDVYDNVRLYTAGEGTLVFVASDAPLDLESEILRNGRPLNSNLLHYSYLGLNGAEDFAASLVLDEQGAKAFSGDAPISTDDRNRMASHSRPQADGLDLAQLTELVAPHDPLLNTDSVLRTRIGNRLDYVYIASRLLSGNQVARAARLADTLADASTRAVVTALIHGANGEQDEARALMRTALRENSRNTTARFALLEPELTALATGQASAEAQELAASLTGPAAAVVRGWAFAVARNLEGLANLDQELARTNVTDFWFPHATRLRADWRTQVAGDSRHAFDALRMLDRAIVIQPGFDLYVLRAAAADELGDASAFVETSRYAVRYLNEYLDTAERRTPLSNDEIAATFTRLDGWQRRLGQLRGEAGESVAEVFDQMGALMYRYEVIARSRLPAGE